MIRGKIHAELLFSSGQAIEGIVDCHSERGSVASRGCFVPDLKASLANPEGTIRERGTSMAFVARQRPQSTSFRRTQLWEIIHN